MEIVMQQDFHCFHNFLTEKILEKKPLSNTTYSEDERYNAYRICLDKIKHEHITSTQTLKKWFGINGISKPNREQLIHLFFALGLSDEQASEWFVRGVLEPDFQVNDFREILYCYGLHNHLSYDETADMIDTFLNNLDYDFSVEFHNQTNQLWNNYKKNQEKSPEAFLTWMHTNQQNFKGYSQSVITFFRELQKEILEANHEEAKVRLEELLGETRFPVEQKFYTNKRGHRAILRYLNKCECGKGEVLSQELIQMIRELLQITESPTDNNSELIDELFPEKNQYRLPHNRRRQRGEIRIFNNKYLTELLNIGEQKEKEFYQMIKEKKQGVSNDKNTTYRLIDRHDLLPMIFCVAQKRYSKQFNDMYYDCESARKLFVDLANQILADCGMALFDKDKYEVDHMLYQAYQNDDMLSYSDVISKKLLTEEP